MLTVKMALRCLMTFGILASCLAWASAGETAVEGAKPVRVGSKLYMVLSDDYEITHLGVWVLYKVEPAYDGKPIKVHSETDNFDLWRMDGSGFLGVLTDAQAKAYFESYFGELKDWEKHCYFVDIVNQKREYEYKGRLGNDQNTERLGKDRKFRIITVDIDVDTDRNGKVDETKDEDKDEDKWDKAKGALYIVNCDDDNADGKPDVGTADDKGVVTSDPKIDQNDELDIAKAVIQSIGTLDDIKVYVEFDGIRDAKAVHLFPRVTSGTEKIHGGPAETKTRTQDLAHPGGGADPHVSATEDRTFGLEGVYFRNSFPDTAFDGVVDLTLKVVANDKDETVLGTDTVRLKVAPWLILPNTQTALELHCQNAGDDDHKNKLFRDSLAKSGILDAYPATAGDRWAQDHVQVGYSETPASLMHVALMLPRAGGQPSWPTRKNTDHGLLGPNCGVHRLPASGAGGVGGTGDAGGNVEATPPGGKYTLGRVFFGGNMSARLQDFFVSQEVQTPIPIDIRTAGLAHADESLMFAEDGKLLYADTGLTKTLLSKGVEGIKAPPGHALFFATGNTDKGTVGGGTRLRVYDGPAHGGVIPVAPNRIVVGKVAKGTITTVAGASLKDGETVTLSDGVAAATFEFDSDGNVKPGNLAVKVNDKATANDVRDAMLAAITGAKMGISAANGGDASVLLENVKEGALGNHPIHETVADNNFKAVGMADGKDADWFAVKDGSGENDGAVAFEFTDNDQVQPGRVAINIKGMTTVEQVRDAIAAAVNAKHGADFTVKAVKGSDAGVNIQAVHMWNTSKGAAGNKGIENHVTDKGFFVDGMGRGKDDGKDFTSVKWGYIRTYDTKVGEAGGHLEWGQTAQIKNRHDGWIEIDPDPAVISCWFTSSLVVSARTTRSFATLYYDPGSFRAGYNYIRILPVAGMSYVLAEGTLWWRDRTPPELAVPAMITVKEVLGNDGLWAYNATMQTTLDAARKRVCTEAGGDPPTVAVPALYFGLTPLPVNLSSDAFVPGFTNTQLAKGHLFYPKPYGPKNDNGDDVFDKYMRSKTSNLGIYDETEVWSYYHREQGEVHCGSSEKRDIYRFKWWERLGE